MWPEIAIQRCTNHKLRNLLAKAPAHLREELAEDYRRMVYADSREAVEQERARLESYEDLRDDVLSVIKNAGVSFEDIHGRCGPHPSTLNSWATNQVHQPQLRKMQSALRIVGYDIGIVEGRRHPDKKAAE